MWDSLNEWLNLDMKEIHLLGSLLERLEGRLPRLHSVTFPLWYGVCILGVFLDLDHSWESHIVTVTWSVFN